jgi:adenylate cyclase
MRWRSFAPLNPYNSHVPHIPCASRIPLENLSDNPEQEYFADGMTDELITNLAKISQTRVVSRTSVMHYKRSRQTLKEIAQELNVDAVVEGTVQRAGDRVRITAQLIHVATDSHLWAESYEQDLSNILELQKEVATDIARQVSSIVKPIHSTRPVNPAAYVAYLKGRSEFYRYTREGWQKSIEYFNEAVQADPSFAPGHAGLAASYLAGVGWEALPPEELPKGTAEARKALELDNQLPSAHFVIAAAYSQEWRWQDAEKEFQRAMQLDPNDALGRQWYSNYLLTLGRFQEAINEQEQARAVDPFSPLINANLAKAFYYARQFDQAIVQARETLKLDPKYRAASIFLERAYRHKGMADLAVSARITASDPEEAETIERAYRDAGLPGVLRAEADAYQRSGALFDAARCYVQIGKEDLAFSLLENYYRRHHPSLSRMKVDPDFDPVRSDLRFRDLLRRIGLS